MSDGGIVQSDRVLYTPADFARTHLNHLQEVGTLKALRVHESRRSQLSSYLFFMVLEGSGTLTVEGVPYPMAAGDCAFVDCRADYRHRSSDDLWQLQWVHFNGPGMIGVYDKYRERGGQYVFTPSPDDFRKLSALLTRLQKTAVSASYIRDMEINEQLTCLLTEIMRNSWHPDHGTAVSSKRKDLRHVRDYLDAHFAEEIRLDDLAQRFFINKYYLTRLFRAQYGTTITGHLTQARITSAKKYLRFSDLTVEQIAAECGYRDANFFIRMFKRSEGLTPGEFRSRWRS